MLPRVHTMCRSAQEPAARGESRRATALHGEHGGDAEDRDVGEQIRRTDTLHSAPSSDAPSPGTVGLADHVLAVTVTRALVERAPEDETANSGRKTGDHQAVLDPVSYTHLRAHETPEHLVCRLL